MLKNNLLMLSVSVMFGVALVAPSAALAQFGPPPGPPPGLAGPPPGFGSPPPGLRAGPPPGGAPAVPVAGPPPRDLVGAPPRDMGAPPHVSRVGGAAGLQGPDHGGSANFRDVEGHAAAYSANRYTSHGYGHGYRHWPYAAAAAYARGGSYSSYDDGCYHVSTYRRGGYKRDLVCRGN